MISYGITDRGLVRQVNEDEFFRSDSPVGCLPNLYVVADGMGGHNAGDVASRNSVRYLVEYISGTKDRTDIQSVFQEAVNYANALVYDDGVANTELRGMGTTIVFMSAFDDALYVGNVGDSRFYAIGDVMEQITVDHSVVEELYRAGHISETEKYHHPDRNMITRALGVENQVSMDFFEVDIEAITYGLVCSDGLTKMMTDTQIHEIIRQSDGLEETVVTLRDAAIQNGGKDNVTLILIDLGEAVGQ